MCDVKIKHYAIPTFKMIINVESKNPNPNIRFKKSHKGNLFMGSIIGLGFLGGSVDPNQVEEKGWRESSTANLTCVM